MAASDADPTPVRAVAYRVTFPMYSSAGVLLTGAAGLDAEVSLDGGAFADCTNESTEIGATGFYYLDLTAAEMTADTVLVNPKTSTSGAAVPAIIMYPAARSLNDLATQALLTTVAGYLDTEVAAILAAVDTEVATIVAGVANLQGRIPTALVSGRMDASVGAMAAAVVTAGVIATDAIGAAELAADAVTEIQSGIAAAVAALVHAELSADPGATPALGAILQYLYQEVRNAVASSDTEKTISKDSGAIIATGTITVVADVVTRGKMT